MKKSFLVHKDSLEVLDDLSVEQCGELFRAIKAYHANEQMNLSPVVKIAFSPFKNQFIRDAEKYEKTCIARADAGSKGGKQRVANASKSKQKVANQVDKDSKKDKDSDNESDKDSIKTLDQNEFDRRFELFWLSGIRKVNKKKTKSLFNNLLKNYYGDPDEFVGELIADVQARLKLNQLGFAEMHPTTYLNGERWNDEKIAPKEITVSGPGFVEKHTGTNWQDEIIERDELTTDGL
jgi:hypothetical protein